MGTVEIPYYVIKRNGRGFWQPTARMRAMGFRSVPCGLDGPVAWKVAQGAYERWLRHRRGEGTIAPTDPAEVAKVYPSRSVGEAWQRYIKSREWSHGKAASTRNKVWWLAWRLRIEPVFGDVDPNTVTMEDLSEWRATIEERDGRDPAHKAMKVWRAFWKIMQALGYVNKPDPSQAVRNFAPKPRHQRWTEGEVVRLVKGAIRSKRYMLAAAIAAIWDTSFQPGDVRTLRSRNLVREDGHSIHFDRAREKTGIAAMGTLSRRGSRVVAAFLDWQWHGVELTAEAFLFVNAQGRLPREDRLSHDFAELREEVFPGERRQMRDMRRSGAVEVIAGGGRAEDLASKLANGVDKSERLWRTYVPVDETSVAAADDARRRGRTAMRGNGKGQKVGTVSPVVLERRR